ncbi:MAG: AraC family transcriptional regulator ligand-binding domain-containing protein [Pseudolabrys sp.]
MPQSGLKQISSLRSCGGLLSRLAYARARQEGIDVEPLLRKAGLTVEAIENKDAPLGVRNQIKFVELVANAVHDNLLGFHLAYTCDPREIGLLYYVAASAETLLDALLRVARYSFVVNDGIVLTVKRDDRLRVRFQYSGVARHTDTHQIESWMAAVIRVCRKVTDRDLKPVHVRIMHARTQDSRDIEKLLDSEIEIGTGADEVTFPAESGDYPIVTADPYLNRLCVRCAEEALVRLQKKTSPLKIRVENAIATLLPHRQTRIDVVAAKLGMSAKTLARRLAIEGSSFADILSTVRSALAHRYLADYGLQISEIAWLLGYSEIGAFTRAFQRWTGTNPRAARAKHQRSGKHAANRARSALKSSASAGKNRQIVGRK